MKDKELWCELLFETYEYLVVLFIKKASLRFLLLLINLNILKYIFIYVLVNSVWFY